MVEIMQRKKVVKGSSEGKETTIALTMTCSKRFHLFKRVVPAFKKHCLDSELITKIIIYDDNSTAEDREKMEGIIESIFPDVDLVYTYFNDIHTKHHHAYIIQHWYEEIADVDYVFHLEDDFLINEDFSILEMQNILKNDNNVGLISIAQPRRDFPEDLLKQHNLSIEYPHNENYWVWPYIKSIPCGEPLFYDHVRSAEGTRNYGFGYYEYFINYSGFGLQPGLMDVKKIRSIKKFELVDKLEAEFGKRYSDKYISICHNKMKCVHIGSIYFQEKSAYEINESIR